MARKSVAPDDVEPDVEPEEEVESEPPHNAIGTPLASDGRPLGYGDDGSMSRQQYLVVWREEQKAAERARLAEGHAARLAEQEAAAAAAAEQEAATAAAVAEQEAAAAAQSTSEQE